MTQQMRGVKIMPLDVLSGKVDEYRQRKDQHNQNVDLVSLDQERIDS